MMNHRQPLLIRDLRRQTQSIPRTASLENMGFRAYLGVSILLGKEEIRVLAVVSKSVRDFTRREVFFLEQLAGKAAIAIHHAMIFDELKRLNEKLENAAQEKSQFLAQIAHDLKTPLTIVTGLVEVMKSHDAGPMSEQQPTLLDKIQEQSKLLLKMVNDN